MNDNYNTETNTNTETETTEPESALQVFFGLLAMVSLAIGAIVLIVGVAKFLFALVGYILYQITGTILLGLFLAIVLIPLCI